MILRGKTNRIATKERPTDKLQRAFGRISKSILTRRMSRWDAFQTYTK